MRDDIFNDLFVVRGNRVRQVLFLLGLLFCCSPYSSPPIALALGLALALTVGHSYKKHNSR